MGDDDEGAMDLVRRRKRLIEDEIGELRRKSDDLKKKSERRLVGSRDRSRSQESRREDGGSRSRREESVRSRRERGSYSQGRRERRSFSQGSSRYSFKSNLPREGRHHMDCSSRGDRVLRLEEEDQECIVMLERELKKVWGEIKGKNDFDF